MSGTVAVKEKPKVEHTEILSAARRVLGQEGQALEKLAASLGGEFVRAVQLVEGVRGRVILTGMGKSGHVAHKIAATLASTGTPAFFVHPAEASHGDLGMVTDQDAVLALSYSGNTAELQPVVAYTRRFRIPLLAMTRQAKSALAEQADVTLLLPDVAEACPLGLAPTTSTAMMMALGDALAVTLLERRNFTAHDFRQFHPGGSLGQRLVKVSSIMHTGDSVPLVSMDARVSDVILVMTSRGFGCTGVLAADGSLAGIITDGDLRRHMGPALLDQKAGEIMTRSPRTIHSNALAEEALAMMNMTERPFTALFVVDDGRPLGILHIHDCLRAGVI
ncbi:MAG: KpsF/GutQ family sugar-phosphate isomerase [Pseudomonadota bacterium]|nr:KpsF/GutQ family sugar-phosphate isomerase [Pseudomonadota bacterium]